MPVAGTRPGPGRAIALAALLAVGLALAVHLTAAAATPAPVAALSVPDQPLLGEDISLTVTFDNVASAAEGYGPYLDLFLPVQGADGDPTALPPEPADGISFLSATYLGIAINVTEVELACDGSDVHPSTGFTVTCPAGIGPGDTLHVLELPFGSFTTSQPAAPVNVTARVSNLADVDVALPISAAAGFRYGADPLDNPATDPPIVQAVPTSAEVTPTLARLDKRYLGPEDETATGPNFPREWRVALTVADGQELTDIELVDLLPDDVVFLGAEVLAGTGDIVTVPPSTTSPQLPPDNEVVAAFPTLTGTGGVSAEIGITFYVPERDAVGDPVLSPTTGAPRTTVNVTSAQGDWDPIDDRDPAATITLGPIDPAHTLTERSLAIQKGSALVTDTGTSGPTPGDTLEWTLSFQVSDYFTFDNLSITDVLSDGQSLDPDFTPVLSFSDVAGAASGVNLTDHLTVTVDDSTTSCAADGAIELVVNLSDAVEAALPASEGRLTGGLVDEPNDGATQGTITFRTIIDSNYRCIEDGAAVDSRDGVGNIVTIFGEVVEEDTLTGNVVTDGSGAGTTIVSPVLDKTIYARNGDPDDTGPRFAAGDEITYRLTTELPIANHTNLTLTDFLPLPVLLATELDDFDFATPPSATPPAAGTVRYGPAETAAELVGGPTPAPTVTIDPVGNSIEFVFSPDVQDQPGDQTTTVDLLFTLTLTDQPFADGLFLTNQARMTYANSFEVTADRDEIVQFELTNPVVGIAKGIVATDGVGTLSPTTPGPAGPWSITGTPRWSGGTISSDSLATTPIDSDLTGVWGGDTVAFAIVVENTGSGLNGAFDVTVADALPDGFLIPAGGIDLQVTDGTGSPLPFTAQPGGLFGDGITLDDPSPTSGSLAPYDPNSGENLAIITYVLEVDPNVDLEQRSTNTATLERYASAAGGPSYPPRSDDATAVVAAPELAKTLLSTSQTSPLRNATIGETAVYEVVVTVPPSSTPDAVLRDTLDTGLAWVSFDALVASDPGLSSDLGGLSDILSSIAPGDVALSGRRVSIPLGTLTNATDEPQTLTFTATAAVLNVTANQDTTGVNARRNRAELLIDGDRSGNAPRAASLIIMEPDLAVSKSIDPTAADAGDTVTFTLTVSHPAGSRRSDAFDVTLEDVVPAGLTYVGGSFDQTAGLAADSTDDTGPLSATWDTFPVGQSATFIFDATVDADAASGGPTITNTAVVDWSSLPGDVTTSMSPYTNDDVERTGVDGLGELNDYVASGTTTLDVVPSTITKALTDSDAAHTSGADLAIGETATYQLEITLPEGELGTVVVEDDIPTGMAYVAGSFALDTGELVGTFTGPTINLEPAGGASGENLVITFDDVELTAGPGTTDTTAVLSYDLVVLDVPANTAGAARTNSATVTVAGATSDPATATATLVVPDVSLTKSFDPDKAAANDEVEITLSITNSGTASAFDLTVADLMDGEVFTDVTLGTIPSGWSGSATAVGDDTLVEFTSDAGWEFEVGAPAAEFTFTATLVADLHANVTVPGTHVNTATVAATTMDGDDTTFPHQRTTSRDGDDTLRLVVPDLRTVKTGPATVQPGDTFSYTITVHNDGERDASDVTIVDILPSSPLLSVTLPIADDGVYDPDAGPNGTVTWTVPSIAEGDSITRTVEFTVDETVPAGSDGTGFVNVADAQHDGTSGPDPTPENNEDGHTVVLDTVVDVGVTKVAALDVVGTDSPLLYTLTIVNEGDEDATGIVLTDTLPDHVSFVSASDGGTYDPDTGVVTWPAFDLAGAAAGAPASTTRTLEVRTTATVPAGVDTLTNVASVTTPGDENPANDTDTADVTVDAAPVLMITKTDDTGGGLASPGDELVYTIEVSNTGDQGATGVTITDTLPAGVTFVSASDDGVHDAGEVTWTLPGELAAGATTTVTLTVMVNSVLPEGATELVNTVTVTDDGTNSDEPTTDSDDETTRLNVAAIGKQLAATSAPHTDGQEVVIGEIATYELTVRLPEGADIGSVSITDTIPAGMAYLGGTVSVDTTGFAGTLGAPTVSLDPAGGSSGQPLTISFNDVQVDTDGDADTATFRVAYDVLVLDATDNTAGADLVNQAALTVAGYTTLSNDVTVTVVEPELVITKAFGFPDAAPGDDGGSAAANDTVAVTLTVTNPSATDAFDVTVSDLLDGDVFVSAALGTLPGGWSGDVTATGDDIEVSFAGATVPAGGSVGLTFSAVLAGDVTPGATHTNTASVVWQSLAGDDDTIRGYGPATGDDTLSFIVPDLRVVKTVDGPVTVEPGDEVTYTIVVHNDGGRAAAGVTVTDTLPDETTFVSASAGGAHDAGVVTWNLPGELAAGASTTLTLTVLVDDPVTAGANVLTNTATATDDGTRGDDPTPDNNTDTASVALDAFVDLGVVKTADVGTVGTGSTIVYTLTVTSNGNEGAEGIVLTDTLPDHVSFVSASDGGTYDPDTRVVTWPAFDLDGADGDVTTAVVTLTVQTVASVPAGVATLTNVAAVSHPDDIDDSNDTDTATVILDAVPELAVTKTSGRDTAVAGDEIVYTIEVTNNGDQGATGVLITDTLPAGVTFLSASDDGVHDDGEVTWTLPGELTAGDSTTVTVTVEVDAVLPEGTTALVNRVDVTDDGSNGPDPDPGNNTDTDTITVGADLAVAKTLTGEIVPGATATYDITVTNNGPATVTELSVVDVFPPGLTAVGFTPSAGEYDPGTSLWTGIDLAPGDTVTLEVLAQVALDVTEQVTNTVTVTPIGHADPDTSNNDAAASGSPSPLINLSLEKRVVDHGPAGGQVTYLLTVGNDGPSNASQVTLTDILPTELAPISASGDGWICSIDGQDVTCARQGLLGPSSSEEIVLVADIRPGVGGFLVNRASVSAAERETTLDDNADTAGFSLVSLDEVVLRPACSADGAVLVYRVTVANGERDTITLTFVNPDGDDIVHANVPLAGTLPWPGTDPDDPDVWPGWIRVDGEWLPGGPSAWARPVLQVVVDAGEVASYEVTYPAGPCDRPPLDPEPAPGPGAVDADGSRLPDTGSDTSVLGWFGGLLLAVGALLLALSTGRPRWPGSEHG